MLRVYQFAPAFGLPNASPFCMKLETWLRMAGLPFEPVNDATAYAFLANLLWAPVDSPIRRHAQARPAPEAYCQRMKARCDA